MFFRRLGFETILEYGIVLRGGEVRQLTYEATLRYLWFYPFLTSEGVIFIIAESVFARLAPIDVSVRTRSACSEPNRRILDVRLIMPVRGLYIGRKNAETNGRVNAHRHDFFSDLYFILKSRQSVGRRWILSLVLGGRSILSGTPYSAWAGPV